MTFETGCVAATGQHTPGFLKSLSCGYACVCVTSGVIWSLFE